MKYTYFCALVLLGTIFFSGCSSLSLPGYEQVYVPLNLGVKDASFLSPGEMEIAQDVTKARANSSEEFKPLRLSKGLSLAARQKALEIADMGRKENAPQAKPLMSRVGHFGKVKGSVAELVSHGYSPRIVVEQLMKKESAQKGEGPEAYFLDRRYTTMGVGCTGDFYPICVLTFATDFEEL